jgi:hypothetical protein
MRPEIGTQNPTTENELTPAHPIGKTQVIHPLGNSTISSWLARTLRKRVIDTAPERG